MASDLSELIHGAAEAKRQLFASEDFADGYGRTVIGRVRRRRAATATAMGGGTVVAVGALAMAAAQTPWSSFVLGADPANSPSVVCTTSTPDAVAASDASVPDAATVAVVDHSSGQVVFVGWVNGLSVAWSASGETIPLETVDGFDGSATLVLDSGQQAVVRTEGGTGWVVPADDSVVTVMSIAAYLERASSAPTVVAEDGTVLGHLGASGDGRFALVSGDQRIPLTEAGDDTYTFVDASGQTVNVTIADPVATSVAPVTAATPTVTCATTTPEPPDNVSITTAPLATDSPFECGYVFSTSGHTSGDLDVGYTTWLTAPDAEAEIRSQYEDPQEANLQTSGKLVPRAEIELAGKWRGADVPGILILGDPADLGDVTTVDEFRDAFGTYQFGVRYVLATHGVVVATAVLPVENQTQYMTSGGPGAVLYGLDLTPAGMETCEGVDEATLAEADVVAVAGVTYVDGDEISGPHYAWNQVARNY